MAAGGCSLSVCWGFTAASIGCGLATSPTTLVTARLLQGATTALMSPQVLSTIHTLFPDGAPSRAFAAFGIALGLGGATGFLLGGWLIELNIGGIGWRTVFFVNGPAGLLLGGAAMVVMPADPGRRTGDLDLPGAAVLFAGLLCLVTPILAARDFHYAWWLWVIEATGAAILMGFLRLERRTEKAGRAPLIDLDLLGDKRFVLGIAATACFFTADISVYLVITLFLLGGPHWRLAAVSFRWRSHLSSRLAMGPGAGIPWPPRCVLEAGGLIAVALVVADGASPIPLMLALAAFGYGQGLVMAPLFGMVLMAVRHAHAGSGAGMLTTVQQVANGVGVALIGGLYFAVQPTPGDTGALLVSVLDAAIALLATAVLLARMGRFAKAVPA